MKVRRLLSVGSVLLLASWVLAAGAARRTL